MKSAKQKALEKFLNDEVTITANSPEGIFMWRDKMYQVLPYKQIRKHGSREDHFIKIKMGRHVYGIREYNSKLGY
jgi:hypothetical protein